MIHNGLTARKQGMRQIPMLNPSETLKNQDDKYIHRRN